jgi:hypothetical protein
MTPSAAQFKKLLREVFLANPEQGTPTVNVNTGNGVVALGERQLLISCVLASAENVEALEKTVLVLAQQLAARTGGAVAPEAPVATDVVEGEEVDEAPIAQATSTVSGHAVPTAGKVVSTSAPQPITPAQAAAPQGSVVSTSAPQPIAPRT